MKVLLFSNDGCGSCRIWKPTFEKLMDRYGLEYEVIDNYSPSNRDIVKKYGVHGIPLTVFLDNSGDEIGSILGNCIEELADRDIKYYIEKDGGLGTA